MGIIKRTSSMIHHFVLATFLDLLCKLILMLKQAILFCQLRGSFILIWVSWTQKTLADLPLLKGRRLMHGQSIVSDRMIYALMLHKSTEKINTEAICSFKHFCWEKT